MTDQTTRVRSCKTLLEAIEWNAADAPARPAFIIFQGDAVCQLSRADLAEEVERWARILAPYAKRRDGVAFIVLKHSVEMYTVFLGAMRAGFIPSFLPYQTPKQDPALYWRSHRALFEHVRPELIITYDGAVESLMEATSELDVAVLDVGHAGRRALTDSLLPPFEYNPGKVALLQHSSGTTGQKKGVMLTFEQIMHQVESYASSIELDESSRIASWLPLYHDMGLITGLLLPVTLGITVISLDAFEWVAKPSVLLDRMVAYGCNFAWLPNFAFAHIMRTLPDGWSKDLSFIHALINCSEPCKAETFDAFATTFEPFGLKQNQLQTCYAMAEAVFAVTQSVPGQSVRAIDIDAHALRSSNRIVETDGSGDSIRFLSCGKAIPGVRVRIKPERSCAVGEGNFAGEIEIAGSFVFSAYYKNEEASAACFDDGWFGTGDIGFIDNGDLFVCGRRKEMFIVHGRNYYAHDVEEIISGVDGVVPGRNVVFGHYDELSSSEEVVAIVETRLESDGQRDRLRSFVRKQVLSCLGLNLNKIRIVDPGWLVKTTSGKLSREENKKKHIEMLEAEAGYVEKG